MVQKRCDKVSHDYIGKSVYTIAVRKTWKFYQSSKYFPNFLVSSILVLSFSESLKVFPFLMEAASQKK